MDYKGLFIEIIMLFSLIYVFLTKTILDKGISKYLVALGIIVASIFIPFTWLTRIIHIIVFFIVLVFYDENMFRYKIKWFLPLMLIYLVMGFIDNSLRLNIYYSIICFLFTVHINKKSIILNMILVCLFIGLPESFITNFLIIIVMIILNENKNSLEEKFVSKYDKLQNHMINEQYQEIKNVYLQMRGWRHDYHNHIQTMKAYLSMGEHKTLDEYFNLLQKDLDEVDTLVKSGNLMMDAILNSKITIMKNHNIDVNCKVILPEKLDIADVDLCVMVGNLLDNAIESCRDLQVDKRFIRIYSEIVGSQFYLSIQNSAIEDLDFNQKNYISSKRGDHGFGVKRVSLMVEKYEGYLNLQNEPGIFASEILIPIN